MTAVRLAPVFPRRSAMKRFRKLLTASFALILVIAGVSVQAEAQRKNDREVRDVVRSLNSKIDDFQSGLSYELKSSSADQQEMDDVLSDLKDLKDSLNNFQTNLDQHRENRDDVTHIIDAATSIDGFLNENKQNGRIDSDWDAVRTLIGRLSSNYGLTPDWNGGVSSAPRYNDPDNKNYPDDRANNNGFPDDRTSNGGNRVPSSSTRSVSFASGLNGTYRLDPSRSESTDQIISESNVGSANRQDLQDKLEAPQEIAIDVSGNRVTLASSKASPVTVIADGREKTDQDASGKTIRLKATLKGDELTVSSLGGETDYTITFVSQENGRSLKVTRRITTDYLNQTVFADSIYTKTDAIAGLGITGGQASDPGNGSYSSNDPNDRGGNYGGPPSVGSSRSGDFIVPNGTVINAILENNIDTKVSQNNDRFKMTVQSPIDLRGAVIEGYITGVGRSGRVSGSSNITFNFETITLRNGQKYDFAGYLQNIKDQNGKVVKVDTEGTAKGDSQTKETVKRGGIGAGAGAIIGAIIGGGKGAAVGAIIGGGAGAGSVIAQGRDDVQLMKGSTITVQASSPVKNDQPRDN
jgi:hypothetical protein